MSNEPEVVSTEPEVKLIDQIESFEHYTELALRTESALGNKTDLEVLRVVLGINAISADILDAFKKQIFYGKEEKVRDTTLPNLNQIAQLIMHLTMLLHGIPDGEGGLITDENTGLSLSEDLPGDLRTMHALLGIITEAGELAEIMVKTIEGEELDKVNLQEELNDINWYQAIAHDANGLDFRTGLKNNINKLIKRYPTKFDSYFATNRNLEAEREQLAEGVDTNLQ